jgi:hypothetical protein
MKMPVRALDHLKPLKNERFQGLRPLTMSAKPQKFVPVITDPELKPKIVILNPVLLAAPEDQTDVLKPSVEISLPRFKVIINNNHLERSLKIARGLAVLSERLIKVAELSGAEQLTINYDDNFIASGVNIGGARISLSSLVLRKDNNTAGMSQEQARKYEIDDFQGLHDADLDEVNAVFVLGHEIAHLGQFPGFLKGFFARIAKVFGPFNRMLEYRADRLAADYVLLLGYSDPIRFLRQTMVHFEKRFAVPPQEPLFPFGAGIKAWLTRSHPTVEQRISRLEKFLAKRAPVPALYAGESFETLSQSL